VNKVNPLSPSLKVENKPAAQEIPSVLWDLFITAFTELDLNQTDQFISSYSTSSTYILISSYFVSPIFREFTEKISCGMKVTTCRK